MKVICGIGRESLVVPCFDGKGLSSYRPLSPPKPNPTRLIGFINGSPTWPCGKGCSCYFGYLYWSEVLHSLANCFACY